MNRFFRYFDHPYFLLCLAVLFWAGNFIVAKLVPADIPPIGLAFWRLLGASVLLFFFTFRDIRKEFAIIKQSWKLLLFFSVTGVAIIDAFNYMGLRQSIALNAFLLQSIVPVLIVFLSFAFYREKLTFIQLLGVLLSLTGVVLFIVQGDIQLLVTLSINHGDILLFIAVFSYSIYSVELRKRPVIRPHSFLFVIFLTGAIILFPFYIWETMFIRPVTITISSLLIIGYVVVFPATLSYLFFNRGVELVGASRAGLFIHLMPVFGSIMAILFLGEIFRWYHGAGMILVGSGIFLVTGLRRWNQKR